MWSSKSCSMASMMAILPARARSMMSACFVGHKRTRSPTRRSTPKMRMLSGGAFASSKGFHSPIMSITSNISQPTDDPMRLEHSVIRERLGSFQNPACTGIAVLHLLLLRVGQREHTQGEHLIHLRAIEKVAGTFRRDLGIVIEDDRRAEHHTAFRLFPHQYRENTLV